MFNSYFDNAGAAIGVHGSQVALLACFFLSYPLGSLYTCIPKSQPALKHAYNIGVSLFFLIGMLNLWSGTVHLLGSAIATYVLAGTMKGKIMPWTVFALVMGHLLISHWIRYKNPSEVVEISGTQMVLIMKLSTFAWNVYDGQQKLETLDESQKETRIPALPDLLSYLGYVLYFPAFLIGPALTYSDYMALVNETSYEKFRNASAGSGVQAGRIPSGRKRVAFQQLLLGVVCMGYFAVYGNKFGYDKLLEPEMAAKPYWYRVLFTQLVGTTQRTKYYGAWKLTEGACIFSGYGFNGYDANGRALWNRAKNVDIPNIELSPNFKIMMDSWNINTNVWLRNSVYKRLVPAGKKPTSMTTLYTFMTSAIWHGVYPGYYLTFFMGSLVSSAAKDARKLLRPLVMTVNANPKLANPTSYKPIYDVLSVIVTLMLTNYLAAPFIVLSFPKSIAVWNSLYWYGHVLIVGWLVWGNVMGGFKYLSGVQKKRLVKKDVVSEGMKTEVNTPLGELVAPPLEQMAKEALHANGNGYAHGNGYAYGNGVVKANGKVNGAPNGVNGRPMGVVDRQAQ